MPLSLHRCLAAFAAAALCWSAAEARAQALPTQSFAVPGLSKPAEILVDQWGIPHIYAGTLYDAFFVQGFNAARDRLWQIDLWRKRGLGRLAESFGPSYVEQDKAARLFLYRGEMYREWLAYSSDAKRVAEAFTAGINAFIAAAKQDPALMPFEFKLLGYEPEPWQAEDVVRIRSHGLTRNVLSEVARAAVACKAGLEHDALRRALEPPWQTRVPDGVDPCALPDKLLDTYRLAVGGVSFTRERLRGDAIFDRDEAVRHAFIESADPSIGSNNWTIAPGKSVTGRPILANDPHRAHSVPSLRYIAHLSAPGLDVIGAGEPSLPGISIGHNGQIAFGLTIFAIDQEDLYVYETNPAAPDEYRHAGRWEPMRKVSETIRIRGGGTATAELKFTRHGPVIFEDREKNRAYAVRAAWLEPGMAPYFGSVDYMRARNWDQFLAAMNRWGAPSENQVYADANGNIGWVPGGLTPIRPNWDGLLPVPGDGRHEWAGYLDRDGLPHEFNPARGWSGTANEMNLPEGYPYRERKLGFEWADPARSRRLAEFLDGKQKLSIEDAKALQFDHLSLQARRLGALLKGLSTSDAKTSAALALLAGWDHRLEAESAPAALFELWRVRHLSPTVIAHLAPASIRGAIGGGDQLTLLTLLETPDQRFGGDPAATRNALLLFSLRNAFEELEKAQGPDPAAWRWGRLHHARFEHALSSLMDDAAKAETSVGPMPKAGSSYTVNASTYRPSDFRLIAGPSFRMVVDVGNWDNSWTVNTPGQSGDPKSPHYRDLADKWLRGEYVPMLYGRAAIERAAVRRIVLEPGR